MVFARVGSADGQDHRGAAPRGGAQRRGEVRALWVDLENVRGLDDPATAFAAVLDVLDERASEAGLSGPDKAARTEMLALPPRCLQTYPPALSAASDRPLVLFLDGADGLKGAAMVSFLTQLRALYFARRQRPAPRSVVLSCARDVRDVVTEEASDSTVPFNITTENVTLAAFTEAEVGELAAQHTAETGQRFAPEAVAHLHYLSAGHPWLVNALADQATRRDVPDRAVAITAAHIEIGRRGCTPAPRRSERDGFTSRGVERAGARAESRRAGVTRHREAGQRVRV